MTVRRPAVRYVLAALMLLVFVVCRSETPTASSSVGAISHPIVAAPIPSAAHSEGLPGMPPVPVERNVYADAGAGMLAPAVRADRPLVYVPDVRAGDVRVIDPETYEVVARYPIGREVQHVVPAYDLRTIYATDDRGNRIVPFNPVTGRPNASIPVLDPYNLYFTPNGASAISVAEAHRELIWYDAHSWRQQDITPTPGCAGINHADFTADGRTAVFTCEFAGQVAVIDIASHRLLRMIDMPHRHIHMGPQDIKLAPNGSVFYIADSQENGVWVLDGAATRVLREIPTGRGAHGLYLSRDARRLFVTDRNEGAISVLDADTGGVLAKWPIPGGGSPDMGNVTADGSQLWLSGRYNQVVYVLSTVNGQLISRIPVGPEPHGLCVWPQPGRYSLGHTGITR
jgi:DNA-binding beta-propeller fold protein YncE